MRARFWGGLLILLAGCSGEAGESSGPGEPGEPGEPGADGSQGGSAGATVATGGAISEGTGGRFIITGASGAAGAPAAHVAFPCGNPNPDPRGGGYVLCADGSLRRPEPGTCPSRLPRAEPDGGPYADHLGECTLDTDCVDRANGYCEYGGCKYGCVADDDCGEGLACFCTDPVGVCIAATCRSDADCPADYPCTAYQHYGFDAPADLNCQSPQDECVTDEHCDSLNPRVSCAYQRDHRICYTDEVG